MRDGATTLPALTAVVDPRLLSAMLTQEYLRTQRHPELPYTIYNYTEKAAYEGVWNPATLTCRGLITHAGTGRVHGEDTA